MNRLRHPLSKAALLVLLFGTMTVLIITAQITWSWGERKIIDPSGGRYFFHRVAIDVPQFQQGDERWRRDLLGPTHNTLGAQGCAVSSAAMVLASYGYDTDPQRLNSFLNTNGGYTPQGWIYWEKAAELANGKVRHAYESLPSYDLIDQNLQRGNPVIVRLHLPGQLTHFVVIAGKQGFDYLTRDPGAGSAKGLYPLKEYGSRIEALRFYERL
jgi:hypothetical protein